MPNRLTTWVLFGTPHRLDFLSVKFTECTLARRSGTWAPAEMFWVVPWEGSLAGGNSFQVHQSRQAVQLSLPVLADLNWAYGLIMTVMVGIVIIGGLRRIASVPDEIVPVMAMVYVAGSAAIAHSAARTEYPVREGVVALLKPFIDTVVICTMTALLIVFSGAYANPDYADIIAGNQGAALTSRAFSEHLPGFSHVLSIAVVLFAYSTMISSSH